jgi:hypothetical protein
MPWRPVLKKATVTADIIWRLLLTRSRHSAAYRVAKSRSSNSAACICASRASTPPHVTTATPGRSGR